MKCAIYARYSSDRQSPESIPDQVRKCREHAARQSWTVSEEHIYSDAAISGTSVERDGLQKLLAVATSGHPPFNIILIDDSSRLTRRLADALNIYEQLAFAGVRVCAISQGVDTASPQAELLIGVHGLIDSAFWRELAQKTHRGMQGRALKGGATGGRCFGYKTTSTDDGLRLCINPDESRIVRRIFKMYARGISLKRIAHQLNSESVASPRPQKGRWSRSWCTSSVQVILNNERYRGKMIWNKTQKFRVPGTGRRVQRPRPESEWVKLDAAHLRIVSEDLWLAVQRRFQTVRKLWGREGKPGLAGQQRPNYLFSGLLRCGKCGGSITLVSGRWSVQSQKYGCSMHYQRGDTICSNSLMVRRDKLESELLRGLQKSVLREEAIDYLVASMKTELEGRVAELDEGLSKMQERKHQLETEIARLVKSIADGDGLQSLTAAIGERERELRSITGSLLDRHPNSIRAKLEELREFAVSRLSALRDLLSKPGNIQEARALLAEQIGKITLVPNEGEYVAKGTVDFFGEMRLRVSGAGGQS